MILKCVECGQPYEWSSETCPACGSMEKVLGNRDDVKEYEDSIIARTPHWKKPMDDIYREGYLAGRSAAMGLIGNLHEFVYEAVQEGYDKGFNATPDTADGGMFRAYRYVLDQLEERWRY